MPHAITDVAVAWHVHAADSWTHGDVIIIIIMHKNYFCGI